MKKSPLLLIAAACFAFVSTASAEVKIATIDMSKVFKEYYKTKEAQERMNNQRTDYKKERDERMQGYQKVLEQVKQLQESMNDPALSESARKEKEDKLKDKIQELKTREREIKEYEVSTQKLLQSSFARVRADIVKEIQVKIEKMAKGKYNLVLDKAGLTMGGTATLIYSDGVADISDEVIKLLNSDKPKE